MTDARQPGPATVDAQNDPETSAARGSHAHGGLFASGLERIRARYTRGWYVGASFGLLYQVFMIVSIWTAEITLAAKIIATVLLVPLYLAFVFLPPLLWSAGVVPRLAGTFAYWAYTFAFLPILGSSFLWLWILVAAIAATLFERALLAWLIVGTLAAVPAVIGLATDFSDPATFSAWIILSVGGTMYAINRQVAIIRELRLAQSGVARLAVVEERARFSRDMHDVIGHSLTVVTVKSELARRLVSIDPGRAEDEIADIERLSRAALADLRAAVAGYRDMSLSTELAVAQASLAAAGIEAHLPASADVAAPDLKELFGWALRESVTNIIRHSQARNCWVTITRTELTIDDDGRGMPTGDEERDARESLVPAGSGLRGLAERAETAGAELMCAPSSRGGLALTVRRAA